MTEFLEVDGGRIAYDVTGNGPLVVLSHGMGDTRTAFRFLAPKLVAAGYRVATADLRGLGESSTGFASYTRTETAKDLHDFLALLGIARADDKERGHSRTPGGRQADKRASAVNNKL